MTIQKIAVPVDLAHVDKIGKALDLAAVLAKQTNAKVCYMGVTSSAPSSVAHTVEEFKKRLESFAEEQGKQHGIDASSDTIKCNDPAVDLGDALIEASKEEKVDTIVMASHVPGIAEHFFASNAGYVASHAPVSVFVVR
ncbi:MAG: universal stress protein [Alphaproteobacteria bacterium]